MITSLRLLPAEPQMLAFSFNLLAPLLCLISKAGALPPSSGFLILKRPLPQSAQNGVSINQICCGYATSCKGCVDGRSGYRF